MTNSRSRDGRVTVVIIQPMFFPWRGQFALQGRADIVISLDTVQWVRRSWYNRNLITGKPDGQWITVPVVAKNHHELKIGDVPIDKTAKAWDRKIVQALIHAYSKAPFYKRYIDEVSALVSAPWNKIAPLAEASMAYGFAKLGKPIRYVRASELQIDASDPVDRLAKLVAAVGGNHYISGPAAKDYINDTKPFDELGIELEWMQYDLPEVPHFDDYSGRELSILDLLFNAGPDASRYIWP